MFALFLTLSASVAPICYPLTQRAPQELRACCDTYPAASGALEISIDGAENAPTLRDIATQYAELTGLNLIFDERTASMLGSNSGGLQASVSVPQIEVQTFFEQLLAANEFFLQTVRDEEPRVVRIVPLDRIHSGFLPRSRIIDESLVEHYGKHAATLVTTTVHLPRADVRQLANSMRAMMTETRSQAVVPADSSGSLVLTGFGGSLADLVKILREIDAASEVTVESQITEIVKLEHASASDTALVLMQAFAKPSIPQSDGSMRRVPDLPRIVLDGRTNSLIMMASPDDMQGMKRVIEVLDVEQ